MVSSPVSFVDVVVNNRDLVVTHAGDHEFRLEPRESDLAWHCHLDDGTPTDTDRDPASFVRWVCPTLRLGGSTNGTGASRVDVRRRGPQSDLGKLLQGFGRLAGRSPRRSPEDDAPGRLVYTDPAGILDDAVRLRIENWPPAMHGDGVIRPAELSSITRTREGLVVQSVSWWDSAPALDHQIGLALEVAHRLATQHR